VVKGYTNQQNKYAGLADLDIGNTVCQLVIRVGQNLIYSVLLLDHTYCSTRKIIRVYPPNATHLCTIR